MALDYGTRRIGVALSDPLHMTAQPLTTLDASAPDLDARLSTLVVEHDVERIVVGLPVHLSGREGPSAEGSRLLAERAEAACGVPVELFDERFTSKEAEAVLIQGGARRADRKTVVDKVAAAVILRSWLDSR